MELKDLKIINFNENELFHFNETLGKLKYNNKPLKDIGSLTNNFQYLIFFDNYDNKVKQQYN